MLNFQDLQGRNIRVSYAQESPGPRFGGGYRDGDGGFGNRGDAVY